MTGNMCRHTESTQLKIFQRPIQHSFMKDLLANKDKIEISGRTTYGSVKAGNKTTQTLWVRNDESAPKTFLRCHMAAASTQ